MPKCILDTDIPSEVLKGLHKKVMERAEAYVSVHEVLTFSSVSAYEILTGLEKNAMHSKIELVNEALAKNEEIVPEREDYQLAAQILGQLRKNGREVGYSDPLIASCAIRRELVLVTGNQRHFEYIGEVGFELKTYDWRQ